MITLEPFRVGECLLSFWSAWFHIVTEPFTKGCIHKNLGKPWLWSFKNCTIVPPGNQLSLISTLHVFHVPLSHEHTTLLWPQQNSSHCSLYLCLWHHKIKTGSIFGRLGSALQGLSFLALLWAPWPALAVLKGLGADDKRVALAAMTQH